MRDEKPLAELIAELRKLNAELRACDALVQSVSRHTVLSQDRPIKFTEELFRENMTEGQHCVDLGWRDGVLSVLRARTSLDEQAELKAREVPCNRKRQKNSST